MLIAPDGGLEQPAVYLLLRQMWAGIYSPGQLRAQYSISIDSLSGVLSAPDALNYSIENLLAATLVNNETIPIPGHAAVGTPDRYGMSRLE